MATSERRVHQRIRFTGSEIAHLVERRTGRPVPLLDLSYGGIRVPRRGLTLPPELGTTVEGQLVVLGASAPLRARVTHMSLQAVGLQFIHEDPTLLLFVRRYLEAARWGSTLVAIGRENLRDQFRGEDWDVLHGEGPVTIRVRRDPGASKPTLAELSLTIRPGDYNFLEFRGGALTGGKMAEQNASGLKSAELGAAASLPREFLRLAVFVLLGDPVGERVKLYQPAIQAICDELKRSP